MRVSPGDGLSDIFDLFAPAHFWLQPVIDDRHADATSGIEASDIAINVCAADAQSFVPGSQAPAMDKNKNRPIGSWRQEEIKPMFLFCGTVPVTNIALDLLLFQRHRFIENSHACAPHCHVPREE